MHCGRIGTKAIPRELQLRMLKPRFILSAGVGETQVLQGTTNTEHLDRSMTPKIALPVVSKRAGKSVPDDIDDKVTTGTSS